MRILLFSFLSLSVFSLNSYAEKFELDKAHTNVTFEAPHLMVSKVRGRFDKYDGTFDFDEQSMKLDNVVVTIRTDSLNTNEKDRDKHLRSPDFFDVAKYPEMKFVGKKTIYDDGKPDKVEGDLTIRGITKPVVLDVDYNGAVTDPWGNRVVSFDAETKVNRRDFGLNWNKALDKGGWVVGDDIKIEIEGEAKPAKAAGPAATPKKK
ncbi:YceI family protein [Bdellovibrio bacteriovorus]|uniref:YceI family protein n=1 Tax=Bdellovibrio bacteriovorus TaxID=959 RepID=UPI0035A71299